MKYLGTKADERSPATIGDIPKLYSETGDNEDGTMTQKAITEALGKNIQIITGSYSGTGSEMHIDIGAKPVALLLKHQRTVATSTTNMAIDSVNPQQDSSPYKDIVQLTDNGFIGYNTGTSTYMNPVASGKVIMYIAFCEV